MTDIEIKKDVTIATELITEIEEESQVVIHCHMDCTEFADAARIWPTTYIVDKSTGVQYPLTHVEGITMYPEWTYINQGESLHFILFFKGLPKSCKVFDFIEVIPQPGAFECLNIPRNSTDIYHVMFE